MIDRFMKENEWNVSILIGHNAQEFAPNKISQYS